VQRMMNSDQLAGSVLRVRVGRGPQSLTNPLQYLYTKPSGSSANYQQDNKKPLITKDHY
jgi:hypothetical protein